MPLTCQTQITTPRLCSSTAVGAAVESVMSLSRSPARCGGRPRATADGAGLPRVLPSVVHQPGSMGPQIRSRIGRQTGCSEGPERAWATGTRAQWTNGDRRRAHLSRRSVLDVRGRAVAKAPVRAPEIEVVLGDPGGRRNVDSETCAQVEANVRDEFGELRVPTWQHIWWVIADGFSVLSPTLLSVCSPAACPGIMQKWGSIRHAERMLCQGRALPPGMSRRRAADHTGRSPGVQRSGRSPSRTCRETSRACFLASSISTQIQPIFAIPLLPVCAMPPAWLLTTSSMIALSCLAPRARSLALQELAEQAALCATIVALPRAHPLHR